MVSVFYERIKKAVNEKDIENTYREIISNYFDETIVSPYGTDGFVETTVNYNEVKRKLLLLMEFKYDEDFENSINIAKVLVQVIYYLKKFEMDGRPLPNITFVGDRNEAFVLHNNLIYKYLDEKIDWSIAPSSAGDNNPDLVYKVFNDPEVNPFIFSVDETFDFQEVVDKIKGYTANVNRMVRITEQNISTIYEYFITKVIIKYQDYDPNELVSIFISLMLNKESSYIHPKKSNTVVVNDNVHMKVNAKNYKAFFSHFQQDYKPEERRKFTEISDRLIEETKRRSQGEYYTPTAFVDYSQQLLSKHLNHNWRNNMVIWDSAWGTGNLTRDYSFRNLFASTLHESDLAMADKYNSQATKFKYDFLNDDPELIDEYAMFTLEPSIPEKLFEHLSISKTPILFYLNPPYATGGNANAKGVNSKLDLAKSVVANKMRVEKLKVSEQLYAQFLYKIIQMKKNLNLENVYIGLFSPSLFLTGQKYNKFRDLFLKEFEFVEGSLFKASHFADVKDTWAIDFSVWKSKKTNENKQHAFRHNILDVNEYGAVEEIGEKTLWNLDDDLTLQDWLIKPKDNETLMIDQPCFTSAFKFSDKIKSIRSDSLGFFINDTNNIEATAKGCYIMPSKINRNIRTITLTEENFAQCMVAFTARNIHKANWINQKDEFSAPLTSHDNYKQFEVLSVVYSIFSHKNNNLSFRNLEVNGHNYSWNNEWFFMKNQDIRNIANENNNNEVYNDTISNAGERFAYLYLSDHKHYLNEEAKELIIFAKDIIEQTFKYREAFNMQYEETFINTWDASWVQIKKMLNEIDVKTAKEFNLKFKNFEINLIKLASELGFLKYN